MINMTAVVTIEPMLSEEMFVILMDFLGYAKLFLGVFGIVGNILIIIVYGKIGFSQSISISFTAMAVSDLCCSISSMWLALCSVQLFITSNAPVDPMRLNIPTGSWPTITLSKTTACITSFISLERCLCVVMPLHVRTLVTRRRTIVTLVVIYLVTLVPIALVYRVYLFGWQFDPGKNQTILTSYFNPAPNTATYYSALYFLYGGPFQFIPLITVFACTSFLLVNLARSNTWRQRIMSQPNSHASEVSAVAGRELHHHPKPHHQDGNLNDMKNQTVATTSTKPPLTTTRSSTVHVKQKKPEPGSGGGCTKSNDGGGGRGRHDRVGKTVLIVALVFLACSTPLAVNNLASMAEPEYRPVGAHRRLKLVVSGTCMLLNLINASVNCYIYYKTRAKFRLTLRRMFCLKE